MIQSLFHIKYTYFYLTYFAINSHQIILNNLLFIYPSIHSDRCPILILIVFMLLTMITNRCKAVRAIQNSPICSFLFIIFLINKVFILTIFQRIVKHLFTHELFFKFEIFFIISIFFFIRNPILFSIFFYKLIIIDLILNLLFLLLYLFVYFK